MITIHELRRKYIDFFKSKDHAEISGKSLIPENDPTVLFTTAGMQPLVPYLLGEPHPAGKRLIVRHVVGAASFARVKKNPGRTLHGLRRATGGPG